MLEYITCKGDIMDDNLLSVRMISMIALSYYEKLINLTNNYMEDSYEYDEIIEKLKEMIMLENKEYNSISIDVINNYFSNLDFNKINTSLEERMFNKLSWRKKVLDGETKTDDMAILSDVIDSKILIDTLKLVNIKINAIDEDNDMLTVLREYHRNSKYTYLSSNNYLELLSIAYNFDIDKIPSINFSDIEKLYGINFVNSSGKIFYYYIIDGMNYLATINHNDKALEAYLSLMELSRIEVLLKYIDKDMLISIMEVYNKEYSIYKDNAALINVKRLIRKRKEEF